MYDLEEKFNLKVLQASKPHYVSPENTVTITPDECCPPLFFIQSNRRSIR